MLESRHLLTLNGSCDLDFYDIEDFFSLSYWSILLLEFWNFAAEFWLYLEEKALLTIQDLIMQMELSNLRLWRRSRINKEYR